MQKITPFLWFDSNCEEAVNYYVDVFNNAPSKRQESKIISIQRHIEGLDEPNNEQLIGKVLTVIFELDGQRFMALDGGPYFQFTEAISFYVDCADQAEVDYFWEKLSAVPESEQCGWVKDKFGLSWQIVPNKYEEFMQDTDEERKKRVMNAVLKMKKLDVAELEKAYRGE